MPLNKRKSPENLDLGVMNETGPLDGILSGMRSRQIDSLKSAINDLNSLILEREHLSSDLLKDIEKIRTDVSNFILEAGNNIALPEKLELRKKLLQIEEMKLQEKLNSWRDVSSLKKELRERQRELSDNEASINAIARIME